MKAITLALAVRKEQLNNLFLECKPFFEGAIRNNKDNLKGMSHDVMAIYDHNRSTPEHPTIRILPLVSPTGESGWRVLLVSLVGESYW